MFFSFPPFFFYSLAGDIRIVNDQGVVIQGSRPAPQDMGKYRQEFMSRISNQKPQSANTYSTLTSSSGKDI